MADRKTTLRLSLRSLDALSFRDARPFNTTRYAESGLPSPQTFAGAIRTFLLRAHNVDLKQFGNNVKKYGSFDRALDHEDDIVSGLKKMKVNGPWLRKNGETLVPVPSNLRVNKQQSSANESQPLVRMDPLRRLPPGWNSKNLGLHPLWSYGRDSHGTARGYITQAGLRTFLKGDIPTSDELITRDQLYQIDRRVGIAIDPKTNTASDGMIYTSGMLVLNTDVEFCGEISGDDALIAPLLKRRETILKFGGEGRYVVISEHEEDFWPNDISHDKGDGYLLLLTTPAYFNGWKPLDVSCIAASVSHPEGISGWDLARGGPKPNRFMVPAGTVYFLSKDTPIPPSLVEYRDELEGWGHFLIGNWNYV